jgi:hypothetical protein
MYSLVSAPVLGFDLTRLQGGSAVADVMLRALSLTDSDLEILSNTRLDNWDRLTLWQEVDEAARQRQGVRELTADSTDADRTLTLLERAPIGTVDGLLHCVRHDVLDWTWKSTGPGPEQDENATRATSVVCDAVVAAYLRELLAAPSRRRLAGGWLAAARWLPVRPVHLGPQHDPIMRLIARIRTVHPARTGRLAKAAEVTRRGISDWAPAVHAASWAVYLAGRVREAAAAQFLLVQAIDDAGIPVADRAGGVWNLLSGAVQAMMVRDMLGAETVQRLVEPCLGALGAAGLPSQPGAPQAERAGDATGSARATDPNGPAEPV